MNLPNGLTCSRILLAVICSFFLLLPGPTAKAAALAVFLLATWTDYWDGVIARSSGQVTPFGRLMDPIADKLLALLAFVAFVGMGLIPAWMVMIIVTRDLIVTGLRFLMPPAEEARGARSSGKAKTAIQFLTIIGILIYLTVRETPLWRAEWTPAAMRVTYYSALTNVAVTLWSGVVYILKNREIFR